MILWHLIDVGQKEFIEGSVEKKLGLSTMLAQLHKAKFRAPKRLPQKGPLTLVNCEINRSYRSPVPLQCRGFLGRICIYGVRKKQEAGRGSCHGISLSMILTTVLHNCVNE